MTPMNFGPFLDEKTSSMADPDKRFVGQLKSRSHSHPWRTSSKIAHGEHARNACQIITYR